MNASRLRMIRSALPLAFAISWLVSGCSAQKHAAALPSPPSPPSPPASSASPAPPAPGAVGVPVADLGPDLGVAGLRWSPDSRMLAGDLEALKDGEPADPMRDTVRIWNLETTATVFSSAGPLDVNPAWLPDGSGIVFMTEPGGRGLQLALAAPGDARIRLITDAHRNMIADKEGVWLDADTLVFFQKPKGGLYQIKTWNRDTGAVQVLWKTPGQDAIVPMVSPDGKKLAYLDRSARPRRLFVVDLDAKKVLFSSKPQAGMVVDHAWGHQPGRLLYVSETKKGCELHRVTLSSGEDKVIATAENFVGPMAVRKTDDEVAIAITGASMAGPRLRIFSIDGKPLAVSPANLVAVRPAWSPDGSRLAYCASALRPRFIRVYVAGTDLVKKAWKPR